MKLIARLNVLLAVALSAEAFVVQTSSTLATTSIIASVNPTTTIELQSYGSRQPSALWMSNENEENVDTEARTEAPDSEGEEAPTEEQEPQEDPEIVAIKEEIAQLDEAESKEFLEGMGMDESGLDRLIKVSYENLGLITYITSGNIETRAWTIRRGMTAPQAAAVIHTDFEKGFIRAEVTSFADIERLGCRAKARESGLMRVEGKEYVVQDGDVVYFRVST